MQDVADLLPLSPPRSSVCESKANSVEVLGLSWGCPLTLMAPRPPHGLCQLRRAVGWQQGTWRSCSNRVMLWLDCQESLRLSSLFGEHRWNSCGQEKCRPLLCSCHRMDFIGLYTLLHLWSDFNFVGPWSTRKPGGREK